jgi:hypothetical protein
VQEKINHHALAILLQVVDKADFRSDRNALASGHGEACVSRKPWFPGDSSEN